MMHIVRKYWQIVTTTVMLIFTVGYVYANFENVRDKIPSKEIVSSNIKEIENLKKIIESMEKCRTDMSNNIIELKQFNAAQEQINKNIISTQDRMFKFIDKVETMLRDHEKSSK